ncbi:hypothetical protein CcaverHIS002_0509050 [Cutaneotrichosporon cavernicola]|nr:hypothetical protein CcaverHIS002_0509050 [Cutaneotrichosporon cavernicola]
MSGNDQELSEAEKMRLKRLARLGGPSTSTPSPSTATPPADPQTLSAASSSGSRLLLVGNSSQGASPRGASPAPAARPAEKPKPPPKAASPAPAPRVINKSSPATSRTATPSTHQTVPSPAVHATPLTPYLQWESTKVAAVFSVTLKKSIAERSDWTLCWLKSLAEEIAEESPGDHTKLNVSLDIRDRLLIARLSLDPNAMATSDDPDQLMVLAGMPQNETVFEYLTGCWKRLYAANREMSRLGYSAAEKIQWTKAFDELKRLIISYAGMTLEDPSMFPQPAAREDLGPAEFLPLLLGVNGGANSNAGDPYTSSTAEPAVVHQGALKPSDLLPFLNDLIAGFPDGSFADVITPTLSLFFQKWFQITPPADLLGDDWRKYLSAVNLLVQVKGIAALPEIWKTYFSNPTDRKVADIDANKANLRHTLGGLQSSLFSIYNSIVRASPEAREGVLEYFTVVCKVNQKRAGMRVDYRTVSTDGFMINIHAVLLKLFEPVMDVQFSKIDKVDTDYYLHSDRLDISDETKIRATKEEADQYFDGAMNVDTKPNFISDLFYLLNSIFHLGLCKTIDTRSKAEKNIQQMEDELKKLEAGRAEWGNNPAARAQGEAGITKLKVTEGDEKCAYTQADIATLHASVHAYDTQLLDPAFTRLNLTFCGFVMTWMLRLVDPKHQHPQVSISLPLPAEAPIQFKMLPEFLLENIVEYYLFLSRSVWILIFLLTGSYNPDALDKADKDILITFALTFVSPTYVNNPFLKAKLINALANGLYPVGYWRKGPLFDQLSVLPLSTEQLMPTLIRFFIGKDRKAKWLTLSDVEMTGGHTQFWDKFNFRRDISRIIKSMWSNPLHREAFVKSARDDEDQFIRFVNMLMSDTTFHLEESLTHLAKIHSLRARKEDTESWNALPENERKDLESELAQAESIAPFHTSMGRDHAELMRDFTATTREPFLVGEIVDRLAASLDENLTNLVGPKMQELKLVDPERFSFKPKQLLAAIAQIYLNLGDSRAFVTAVANDGRSYTKELFERFARVLKNRAIMTDGEVAGVVAFTQRVEDAKATIEAEEEREIPDEFLDPLMATLMKDPVILPVSRVTVDRSTIRASLLSKELDPFNNVPMKYEDVVPNTELKAQIDAWLAETRVVPPKDVMDVDEL